MMNFKYIAKKAAMLSLVTVMSLGTMTGCGDDTKIVFTTGISGNQIFKIGSTTGTMPEAMVYLTTFYNQYGDIYGEAMWNYDFGGVSLEEHVKDVVLTKLAQIKIMNLMAEEQGISLSKEEQQNVLAASQAYYEKLPESLREQEEITEKVVENVYKEYAIANKVYATITESADMEISDDEARTVVVQMLKVKDFKTAKEALGKINLGEDFESVAAKYSEDKQIVKNYARGVAEASFEELLFSMDEGEISKILEISDGYCIVKCISTMDYEATQANKLILAEQRKKEAFSKAYQEVAVNTHSQFRDKHWEKLTLQTELHSTDANFFEIYDEYVK